VDRPEHATEHLARAGLTLQRDQVAVELIEVLVTLDEEFFDDLVVRIAHARIPAPDTKPSTDPKDRRRT
jgi:restriction endonuclease Mrr